MVHIGCRPAPVVTTCPQGAAAVPHWLVLSAELIFSPNLLSS